MLFIRLRIAADISLPTRIGGFDLRNDLVLNQLLQALPDHARMQIALALQRPQPRAGSSRILDQTVDQDVVLAEKC